MAKRPERYIPQWAKKERISDMDWIKDNLPGFWLAARIGYETAGRGALGVDTTQTFVHEGGVGHPFSYLDQTAVEQLKDEDMKQMVREYDPGWEMVTVLFKPDDRLSTYRIRVIPPGARENLGSRRGYS